MIGGDGMENVGEFILDGVATTSKAVIKWVSKNGVSIDGIFVVVAICGIFVVMTGFRKVGTKMTSGSIVGYIICKVVSEVCK